MLARKRWIGWTLALGVLAGLIALGFWLRDAPRIQPIEPHKLAQLSEEERAEWLIEQILARSQSRTPRWKILEWLGYGWKRTGYELNISDLMTLGEACLKYDEMGKWTRKLPTYVMNNALLDQVQLYQARWRLQQGDLTAAQRIIQQMPHSEARFIALAYYAASQARRGDRDAARHTIAQLPHDFVQPLHTYRSRAVIEMAQAGMLDEAAQLVEQAPYEVLEDTEPVRDILDAYKYAGRWNDALGWARQLLPGWREYALGEWAAHALQQGDPDPTRRLNPTERTPGVLMRLARAAYEQNHPQQARQWRDTALKQLERLPPQARDAQRMQVAIELARMGDFEQAERIIRIMAWGQSLRTWAAVQAAHSALTQNRLDIAQRLALNSEPSTLRTKILARIAARYYQIGQHKIAQTLIDRCLQDTRTANRVHLLGYLVGVLHDICMPAIEEGGYELVSSLLRHLETEMKRLDPARDRVFILWGVIQCYVKAGKWEEAFRLAAEADTREGQARALLAILSVQVWEND